MATKFYNNNWRMPRNANQSKASNFSMAFDGTDDKITFDSITLSSSGTISAWAKRVGTANVFLIGSATTWLGWAVYFNSTIRLFVQDTSGQVIFSNSAITTALARTDWVHWAIVKDATAGTLSVYVDGTLAESQSSTVTLGEINTIGGDGTATTAYIWDGNIDHVAIFDYALTLSDVQDLFGNSTDGVGNPMDLTTDPVAYYKLGDLAAYNGTNYLVPNAISTNFSNYALDFDGIDDKINLSSLDLGINCCISLWVNLDSGFNGVILGEPTAIYNYTLYCSENSAFNVGNATTYKPFTGMSNVSGGGLSSGSWNHIVINRTGDVVECFLNGSSKGTQSGFGISSNTLFNTIGGDPANLLYQIEGSISNISAFNTTLSAPNITTLYNSGKPSDLSSFSPAPIAWWQLGENSYYDGSDWIVLDEIGTNNGTSSAMNEDALVNGVQTTANGVSSGMGTTNIIGDAPYSTANAISYNMSVTAKETSTP